MKTINGGAPGRAQVLLSKFKFSEVDDSNVNRPRNLMFFDYQLPPAYSITQAINMAMDNEGIVRAEELPAIEVTDEQAHNINYLLKLFTAVDPVWVDQRTHYHYHISKMFKAVAGINDPSVVIASAASYTAPTPLVGLWKESEVYYAVTVALRKACDSKPTTILWNASHGLSDEARRWVCEPIETVLRGPTEYATVEDFVSAAKAACLEAEYSGKYEQQMIHCLYELFTNDDWAGYFSYLIKWQWQVDEAGRVAKTAAETSDHKS
jgi:hypothetical protein